MKEWQKTLAKIQPERGWLHAHFLCAAVKALGIQPLRMAEVGVFKGRSAKIMRDNFPQAQLWLIDPWGQMPTGIARRTNPPEWTDVVAEVDSYFANDPLTVCLRGKSSEAAELVHNPLDVVFIDACHRYNSVLLDIALWQPHVRRPGLICGHDFSTGTINRGVRTAVQRCFRHYFVGHDKTWFVYLEAKQ